MKVGKVPETVLKRSVFKQIKHRRQEVLVSPGVGKDCSVVAFDEGEAMVISTDPITGAANQIGILAVHITANDIASSGGEIVGIMLSIILPNGSQESELREIMIDVESACKDLNIEVIGGHTEVSAAVNQPIITVTGVGKVSKDNIITTAGMQPSQELVMTKWAGLEGTAIIADDKEEDLRKKYTGEFIGNAKDFIQYISVVKEAKIGKLVGVTAMHDATEGGIFGALWEMAEASKVGMEIDLKKIPIRQETVEICEFFDLNPYLLISSGCMLMSTDKGNELVEALAKEGIPAAVIGRVTTGNDRIVINEDEKRYLEPPKSDELYKVI
jgi:hydrogenase expression/formation protein HypE